MNTPNHEPSAEGITTAEATWELKTAQMYLFVSPMEWTSNDEQHRYIASPLELPGEESVDLTKLGDMPVWRFGEVLNVWTIGRIAKPDINGDVAVDQYLVATGQPLRHVSNLIPAEMFDKSAEEVSDAIEKSSQLQGEVGLDVADPEDYEALGDAIEDLKVVARVAQNEMIERMINMTEEEKRLERMQQFEWLVTPEMKRDGEPRWWGVTEGGLLWAVRSATPDEAIIMIEDARDGIPIAPIFFVDDYPDDIQEELKEKMAEEEVVRLIPFSTEPWPDDLENMTEEQQEAFNRLKRD